MLPLIWESTLSTGPSTLIRYYPTKVGSGHRLSLTDVGQRKRCSTSCSATIRTACARTSGENLFVVLLVIDPHELGSPANPVRFNMSSRLGVWSAATVEGSPTTCSYFFSAVKSFETLSPAVNLDGSSSRKASALPSSPDQRMKYLVPALCHE